MENDVFLIVNRSLGGWLVAYECVKVKKGNGFSHIQNLHDVVN